MLSTVARNQEFVVFVLSVNFIENLIFSDNILGSACIASNFLYRLVSEPSVACNKDASIKLQLFNSVFWPV